MAYDVNAARAQRIEAHGASFDFTLDGENFSFPTELDITALESMKALDSGDLKGLIAAIMQDADAAARLFTHKLSVQDLKGLMAAWKNDTGVSVGEDSPSAS